MSALPLPPEDEIESPFDFFPLRESLRVFPVDVVIESLLLLPLFKESLLLFLTESDEFLPPLGDSRLLPPPERDELLSLLFFHDDSLVLPEREGLESVLLFKEGDPLLRLVIEADFPLGGLGAQYDFVPGSGILLGRLLGDIC